MSTLALSITGYVLGLASYALPSPLSTSGLRDHAGLFSPAAAVEANAELKRINLRYGKGLLVETHAAAPGDAAGDVAPRLARRAAERARATRVSGMVVVISAAPPAAHVACTDGLPPSAARAMQRAIDHAVAESRYDDALSLAVRMFRAAVEEHVPPMDTDDLARPAERPTVQPDRDSPLGTARVLVASLMSDTPPRATGSSAPQSPGRRSHGPAYRLPSGSLPAGVLGVVLTLPLAMMVVRRSRRRRISRGVAAPL